MRHRFYIVLDLAVIEDEDIYNSACLSTVLAGMTRSGSYQLFNKEKSNNFKLPWSFSRSCSFKGSGLIKMPLTRLYKSVIQMSITLILDPLENP